MQRFENKAKETLKRDIHISNVVDKRLQETYQMLGLSPAAYKRKNRTKRLSAAAAAAVILCCIVPGAAIASGKLDFFEGFFGNTNRRSTGVIEKEMDTGKGSTITVTIPSKEYVPVDEEKAWEMIGSQVMDEPIEKEIGGHKLRIENFAYDKNGALAYFTLEKAGGITALKGDDMTNLEKGATFFTEESDFNICFWGSEQVDGHENIYIDTENSTSEKMYCYAYILWGESLKEGDIPQLEMMQYPCTFSELYAMDDEEREAAYKDVKTERVKLTDKGQIPVRSIDMGEEGYLEYSPVSMNIDMTKGLGFSEEEAADPGNISYLEIKYKDGTNYVITDREKETENSGYVIGTDTGEYKVMFNRLVDVNEVEEIVVNDVSFVTK